MEEVLETEPGETEGAVEVVRYYWTPGGVLEDEDGNLVMLDDHLAALSEERREEREALLKQLRGKIKFIGVNSMQYVEDVFRASEESE
jgi:ABC-type uncharacterized transport system ATPase subunit